MTSTRNFIAPVTVLAAALLLSACERPPIDTEQVGYRGTAMVLVENPRAEQNEITVPEPQPAASSGGPKAGAVYQNVQVLGDLNIAEFTRTMLAITQWVAPDEGCNYCHNPADLADDSKYTKVVSRRMIQMTQHVNREWTDHHGGTGVTCYTCHAGNNVPENIWFKDPSADNMKAYTGNREGQNIAAPNVGYASLPADPFSRYLEGESLDNIAVNTVGWQPTGDTGTIQKAEGTYALMFHLSSALGVNCNFCHNSRAFAEWDQSRPQRVTAWHGLRMVAGLNNEFLNPLQPVYPDYRLGPTGDAPKANCGTCHQGANKPLGGVNMVADYPALQ